MSSFNGQMKEYTRIAIDRFDGKNLQCTTFFLSHCHKDHMVGLNSSSFVDCLLERDGVFLYCSEITRLLLLAEKEYSRLINYIRVLKVGVIQTVTIPANSTAVEDYYVKVTPISAGHCPGSVMFLFEGHEGTCLYTGDFRWEISHAAGITSFKEENRVKEIQSLYIDTTFCIPEAYHIPKRSECVEAAMTVVSDWLQRSSVNIVLISCPARYGHEHLLMELSKRLNVKIHVPEWKVQIYDQINDLKNVFTPDSKEARIHACSAKVGYLSCLPYSRTLQDGKKLSVLKLRPSTMWFTSDKSKSTTQDLIVTPVSQRGLYRICYSMHSSYSFRVDVFGISVFYSEIRDLVSYLQPKHVYPNVIPASEAGIEPVQTRLNSFQKHFNKARALPSVVETYFQPLGTLRKVETEHARTQQQSCKQDAESSDELMFSSQETSPNRELLKSVNKSHISRAYAKCDESINFNITTDESPSPEDVTSNLTSQSNSSYTGSFISDQELNLFSDNGEDGNTVGIRMLQTIEDNFDKQKVDNSLCPCVSSDSDIFVNASNESTDVNVKGAYDVVQSINYYAKGSFDNVPEVNKTYLDINTTSQTNAVCSDCATRFILHDVCSPHQDLAGKCCSIEQKVKQKEMNPVISNAGSELIRSTLESTTTDVNSTVGSNSEIGAFHNTCQDNGHSDDDNDDIVLSSQVFPAKMFYENHLIKATSSNASTVCNYSSNVLVSDNKSAIEGVPNLCNSLLTHDAHGNSKETLITVLSSSDDSQNTIEQESQALWSVNYNLDNCTPCPSFVKTTTNGTSYNSLNAKVKIELNINQGKEHLGCINTVEADCIDKEGLSFNKIGGNTLYTTKQFLDVQHSPQRKAIKVTHISSLKRNISKSLDIFNASNIKRLKTRKADNKSNILIDKTSSIKNECVVCCERVVKVSKSIGCHLKKVSDSKCETISSDINSAKDYTKFSANNSHIKGKDFYLSLPNTVPCSTHDHKLKSCSCKHSDGDFLEVLTQSVNELAPHKSECIDLTVEAADDVVDLTLESSQ